MSALAHLVNAPRSQDRPAVLPLLARQTGVAMLALLALLGLLIGALVFGFAGKLARDNAANRQTVAALAQAKAALIGYAATYRDEHPGEVFGYLPCPDLDGSGFAGEGGAAGSCGAKDVTVIGRLPWKTLELPPLRDGSGECLWYAVSGNFKANPETDLMNWDTNGLIEIMAPDGAQFVAGAVPTQRAVAVIFAPGAILSGQDRTRPATSPPNVCGGNYNPSGYLDTDTSSGVNNATAVSSTANALSRFIAGRDSDLTSSPSDSFNDRVAFITPDEIFAQRVEQRSDFSGYLTDPNAGMARIAADCIAQYGHRNGLIANPADKRLPWAAALVSANYGLTASYSDVTGRYSGRLPYSASNSALATVNLPTLLAAGVPFNSAAICPGWTGVDEFWKNWKEHVFYAVAKAFAPNNLAAASLPDPCAADECLSVDGVGGFAAVIIFANKKQGAQSRNNDVNPAYSSAEKSFWSGAAPYSNYLEGANAIAIQQNSPSMASPRQFSKLSGNDTVMCIRADPVTGLYVDPTCASSSQCNADGIALSGYRSGTANNCRVGKDSVLPACQTLVDRINTNNCSCEKRAKEFVSKECLTKGFTTSKCINAYNALLAC